MPESYIIPKKNQYPMVKLIPNQKGIIQDINLYKNPTDKLPTKCNQCKYCKDCNACNPNLNDI